MKGECEDERREAWRQEPRSTGRVQARHDGIIARWTRGTNGGKGKGVARGWGAKEMARG